MLSPGQDSICDSTACMHACMFVSLQARGMARVCLQGAVMSVQGFHSEDSEDNHSDDENDHVEGMSGDEQMQEQEDFEGSDDFDQVRRCLILPQCFRMQVFKTRAD